MKKHFHIYELQHGRKETTEELFVAQKTNYFEIIFVTSGIVVAEIEGRYHTLEKNSVCIVVAGQNRAFAYNDLSRGYYLSFCSEFLFTGASRLYSVSWKMHFYGMFEVPVLHCNNCFHKELNIILGKIAKEWNGHHLFHQEVIAGLLNVLLIDLSRVLPASVAGIAGARDKELCREFIRLVSEYYLRYKRVHDYASLLFVSPGYLNTVVKKITGQTAKQHIQQLLITEAKKILVADCSMKAPAYELGFVDLAHFSKFFKKNAGINFKTYRKSFQ